MQIATCPSRHVVLDTVEWLQQALGLGGYCVGEQVDNCIPEQTTLGSDAWCDIIPVAVLNQSAAASGKVPGTTRAARLRVVSICSAFGRSLAAMRQRDTSAATPLPVWQGSTARWGVGEVRR